MANRISRLPSALVVATALFVATACGSSGSSTATSTAPPSGAVDVGLSDYMIMPHALSATAGTVSFAVHNDGKTQHNFWIRSDAGKVLAKTKDVNPGQKVVLTADLTPGTYTFYCEVPGHESLGMKGTLTVS